MTKFNSDDRYAYWGGGGSEYAKYLLGIVAGM
jgi:hypothetical protein